MNCFDDDPQVSIPDFSEIFTETPDIFIKCEPVEVEQITVNDIVKNRRTAIDWQKCIDEGIYFLRNNSKDERYSSVINHDGKIVAQKCNNCTKYFKGDKPGGSFYKHLDECSTKAGKKHATINNEQREVFLNSCVQLMSELFISSAQLNSVAFKNVIQTAVDIGFECGRSQPHCLPPNAKDLIYHRTFIMDKFQTQIVGKHDEVQRQIFENVKAHSGSLVVDVTSKLRQSYAMVLHFFDHDWNLKVVPLDIQTFEEDSTATVVHERTKEVLDEFGLEIEDVNYKTGRENEILSAFENVEKTPCSTTFLKTISKQMLKPNDEAVFDENVHKTIDEVREVIQNVKKLVTMVCDESDLHSVFYFKLKACFETLPKLQFARQFLELSADDLKMLQDFNENLSVFVTKLMDEKQIIMDYVDVMTKIEEVVLRLEEVNKPTIHLVKPLMTQLESQLKEMCLNESEVIRALAISALAAWNVEFPGFNRDVYDIACFLDPNELPNLPTIFDDETLDKIVDKFKKAVSKYDESESAVAPSYELIKRFKEESNSFENLALQYLQDAPQKSRKNFDLLEWWKKKESTYPSVAKLAKRILSIPASSTSLRNLFSDLNETKRKQLKDSTITNLIKYRMITEFKR